MLGLESYDLAIATEDSEARKKMLELPPFYFTILTNRNTSSRTCGDGNAVEEACLAWTWQPRQEWLEQQTAELRNRAVEPNKNDFAAL